MLLDIYMLPYFQQLPWKSAGPVWPVLANESWTEETLVTPGPKQLSADVPLLSLYPSHGRLRSRCDLVVKNLPVSAGGVGQEDSLEKENGSLHQCSCLENPMDREPGRL